MCGHVVAKPTLFLLHRAVDVREILDTGDVIEGSIAEGAAVIGVALVACCFDLDY